MWITAQYTLPRQWSLITISQDNHSFILCSRLTTAASCLYSRRKERWRSEHVLYAYNRHLSFDVAFICSTLAHCGVCHLSVWRLKWGVSYVTDNIIIKRSWKFCGLLLSNRESNSLLLANAAAYYYYYYYYWQYLTRLLLLLWYFEKPITITITFTPQSLHYYYYYW